MGILANENAISSGGYTINNSLRIKGYSVGYLNRTPSVTGNRKTWTYSAWVKRGIITFAGLIAGQPTGSTGYSEIEFLRFSYDGGVDSGLEFGAYSSATMFNVFTQAAYRDPSAWYHVVLAVDTTQATASNRVKFYINGVEQTKTSGSTYPPLNFDTYFNSTAHKNALNSINGVGDQGADGLLAEVNFIDGQALTASSFGETNALTGVWQPKQYAGTYGTNGFYLKFSEIALTSGSNSGLGKDFSGNGNYWNTNNISVTNGINYDAMIDSPTMGTNATQPVGNYAVLNPLLQNGWWATPNRGDIRDANLVHYSGGNTTAFSNFDLVANSGKWYYEMTCGATDSANSITIAAQSRSTFEVTYYQNGQKQINGGTPSGYGSSWTNNDVIGVAIDVPNNTITFYKNGTSQGAITNTFPTTSVYAGSYFNTTSGSYYYNFGQRPFAQSVPSGYKAMVTTNLPDGTIVKGNKYMDATTYTGNGSSQTLTNTSSFKPDFIWVKNRSNTVSHCLVDSVRGASNNLASDLIDAENAGGNVPATYGTINSITASGFGVLAGSDPTYKSTNGNTQTYVGWQWQAGQGTTSSNTSGSITSTVSVNATAGFSIVTYTGTGANATVGHGLGVAPKMMIIKQRTGTARAWQVYHASLGAGGGLYLNQTNAYTVDASAFNNTAPTSTVFSLGSSIYPNQSGSAIVAYCFAEIAGFSKFGSYTGNGSADGTFIYTGFRPKYFMFKRTDATSAWTVIDSVRSPYNGSDSELAPNTSGAEATYTATYLEDLLSNGIKMRNTGAGANANGGNYIYAAFAENPFKNALAR